MTDRSLGERVTVEHFAKPTGESDDIEPSETQAEWGDMTNAAWYLAFMPMLVWSGMASSTLKMFKDSMPHFPKINN